MSERASVRYAAHLIFVLANARVSLFTNSRWPQFNQNLSLPSLYESVIFFNLETETRLKSYNLIFRLVQVDRCELYWSAVQTWLKTSLRFPRRVVRFMIDPNNLSESLDINTIMVLSSFL